MVRIAISQAGVDAIAGATALGIILFAAPACAGSRFGGGFHGFRGGGFPVFHHPAAVASSVSLAVTFGYNCGLGFYNPGYGYCFNGDGYGNGYFNGYGYFNGKGYFNGYGNGNGYGYSNGAGNAVSISNGLTGGYVPDPVGADIPRMIIPTNCWVRRPAYDPSGAYFGQVLVNLCRPSDSVIATDLKARPKTPDTGAETQPPPCTGRLRPNDTNKAEPTHSSPALSFRFV